MSDELTRIEAKIDDLADDMRLLRVVLTGNGDPSKGLIVRVAQVEVMQRNYGKWLAAATSAVVLLFVGGAVAGWKWLIGHF